MAALLHVASTSWLRATCASNSARVARSKRSIRARASPTVTASASTSADAFAAAPSWTSSSRPATAKLALEPQPPSAAQHAEHAPLERLPLRHVGAAAERRAELGRRRRRLERERRLRGDGKHLRLRAERRRGVGRDVLAHALELVGGQQVGLVQHEDDRLAPLGD